MKKPVVFNRIMLGENLAVGQRVESFAVDVWNGNTWQEITTATTIGYKRLLLIPTVKADKVRVRVLASRAAPSIVIFGLFMEGTRR